MKRTSVNSSSIASIGYDEAVSLLEIEFKKGTVYQYANVPKSLFDALMKATSKGRFFDQNIREKFRTTKVG